MKRPLGFTLIELMVTLAVFVILATMAMPSFFSFRQRAATRDAGDEALSFWNQARFEAAKRNAMVKVGVYQSGSVFCLGAATTTDPADSTPCNCSAAAPTTNVCDIARFPVDQNEWRAVSLSGTPTLGGNTGVAVIDPKLTSLTESTDAGAVSFLSPGGSFSYKLNLRIDALGRGVLCESTGDTRPMSDYLDRRCAP